MSADPDIWELWAEGKPIATMRLHEVIPPVAIEGEDWLMGTMIFMDFEELPAFDKYWTRFDEYQDRLDAAFAEEEDAAFEAAYEKCLRLYTAWIKPLRLQVIHPASGTIYTDTHMTLQVMDNWTIHVGYDVKSDSNQTE